MSDYYPPVGFSYQLSFTGDSGEATASFKEVSGISMDMTTSNTVKEDEESRFTHRLPSKHTDSNLVLKRGIMAGNSELRNWCIKFFEASLGRPLTTKAITVKLLDSNGQPLTSWNFINAYPVKIEISSLNAEDQGLIIESLEFAYDYFERR
ncbi:MAG: hypothetical protein DHS20C18_23250 [Saprospiraceae bacterium]|nr:MAG: hypothetical protein DHS20C18_23250 [Saprospiraceae bacterium]